MNEEEKIETLPITDNNPPGENIPAIGPGGKETTVPETEDQLSTLNSKLSN